MERWTDPQMGAMAERDCARPASRIRATTRIRDELAMVANGRSLRHIGFDFPRMVIPEESAAPNDEGSALKILADRWSVGGEAAPGGSRRE